MPRNVERHSQMAKTAQIRWSKIPPWQTCSKVKIVSNCPYYFTIAYIVIHSYEVFSGVSLACCCIYWAGLIAPICRSQRYWWLWDKFSTNDGNSDRIILKTQVQDKSSIWSRLWLWRPLWSYPTCPGRWCSSARWCLQRQIIFEPISPVWRSRLSHLCFSL